MDIPVSCHRFGWRNDRVQAVAHADLVAAKLFLRLALSRGVPSPRVINVDGHPAYPRAIDDLKASGELGALSLPNGAVLEQRHRAGPSIHQKANHSELGFRSVEGACRTIAGYEAMHAIRKSQVRWVAKVDPVAQRDFIHTIFGVAA